MPTLIISNMDRISEFLEYTDKQTIVSLSIQESPIILVITPYLEASKILPDGLLLNRSPRINNNLTETDNPSKKNPTLKNENKCSGETEAKIDVNGDHSDESDILAMAIKTSKQDDATTSGYNIAEHNSSLSMLETPFESPSYDSGNDAIIWPVDGNMKYVCYILKRGYVGKWKLQKIVKESTSADPQQHKNGDSRDVTGGDEIIDNLENPPKRLTDFINTVLKEHFNRKKVGKSSESILALDDSLVNKDYINQSLTSSAYCNVSSFGQSIDENQKERDSEINSECDMQCLYGERCHHMLNEDENIYDIPREFQLQNKSTSYHLLKPENYARQVRHKDYCNEKKIRRQNEMIFKLQENSKQMKNEPRNMTGTFELDDSVLRKLNTPDGALSFGTDKPCFDASHINRSPEKPSQQGNSVNTVGSSEVCTISDDMSAPSDAQCPVKKTSATFHYFLVDKPFSLHSGELSPPSCRPRVRNKH